MGGLRIATLSNASVVHTWRWVRHLRARGHDVRLYSLEPGPADLAAIALPAAPLPGALRYPLALPALRRALRAFAPELVDAHYVPNYGLLGALSGWRPLVVTAWGSDLLLAGPSNAAQRARARFVLRRADLVQADSDNLGAAARALGAAPGKVHVVPWGVDLARFVPGAREPGLLLSTRMHETVYDLPTLFAGVRPVLEERPDARLVVAGDGSQRASLESLARRTLPAGRVTFTGRLSPEALADWLGRAEVYLSASWSDSTSLSLLEAMAAGALPVVSDIPGNREWIADGDGARTFAPGDAQALSAALRSVLADPAWAAAARARNRREVEARGDWNANLARIEARWGTLVGAAR